MKIKSLLLGSAAALVAATGARAADAVVIPEPEAVEYVRVCDAAGAGYFYIPGTETCLRFSGYVRYEMNLNGDEDGDAYGKRLDVNVNIDAWNDTELGPLFSRVRVGVDQDPRNRDGDPIDIELAYIQLAGLTIGRPVNYWDWGFGADGDGLVDFGPGDIGTVAYTANLGGFGVTLAALQSSDESEYMPDIILDVVGSVGDFGVHGGVAYNEDASTFSAKIAGSYDFGAVALQIGYQYSDLDGADFADNSDGDAVEYLSSWEHVVGADVGFDLTEQLAARVGFNYGFGDEILADDGYVIGAGINYQVVSGFDIDARVRYLGDGAADDGDNDVDGRIRFTRTF